MHTIGHLPEVRLPDRLCDAVGRMLFADHGQWFGEEPPYTWEQIGGADKQAWRDRAQAIAPLIGDWARRVQVEADIAAARWAIHDVAWPPDHENIERRSFAADAVAWALRAQFGAPAATTGGD